MTDESPLVPVKTSHPCTHQSSHCHTHLKYFYLSALPFCKESSSCTYSIYLASVYPPPRLMLTPSSPGDQAIPVLHVTISTTPLLIPSPVPDIPNLHWPPSLLSSSILFTSHTSHFHCLSRCNLHVSVVELLCYPIMLFNLSSHLSVIICPIHPTT